MVIDSKLVEESRRHSTWELTTQVKQLTVADMPFVLQNTGFLSLSNSKSRQPGRHFMYLIGEWFKEVNYKVLWKAKWKSG